MKQKALLRQNYPGRRSVCLFVETSRPRPHYWKYFNQFIIFLSMRSGTMPIAWWKSHQSSTEMWKRLSQSGRGCKRRWEAICLMHWSPYAWSVFYLPLTRGVILTGYTRVSRCCYCTSSSKTRPPLHSIRIYGWNGRHCRKRDGRRKECWKRIRRW